jgi:L,D-peptidoglycan transpeptidase YkuD (ErfK/YbiS/YcfS/YnhG family)
VPQDPPGSGVPAGSRQALVVTTGSWRDFGGRLDRFSRAARGAPWTREAEPIEVALGRNGLGWGRGLHPEGEPGPVKREGDSRSPAGVFDLGEARGYATAPPDGTLWPFERLVPGWHCIDDSRSPLYNSFIVTDAAMGPSAWDGLRRDVVFELMVSVRHNMEPVVRGAGSCVLVHIWQTPGLPSLGCTVMSRANMQRILTWLRPESRPVLVQLPADVMARVAEAWGVPR